MSVRNRLEDARVLFSAGRQQGAFAVVLIAAAATSRKRYPRDEWDDSGLKVAMPGNRLVNGARVSPRQRGQSTIGDICRRNGRPYRESDLSANLRWAL